MNALYHCQNKSMGNSVGGGMGCLGNRVDIALWSSTRDHCTKKQSKYYEEDGLHIYSENWLKSQRKNLPLSCIFEILHISLPYLRQIYLTALLSRFPTLQTNGLLDQIGNLLIWLAFLICHFLVLELELEFGMQCYERPWIKLRMIFFLKVNQLGLLG